MWKDNSFLIKQGVDFVTPVTHCFCQFLETNVDDECYLQIDAESDFKTKSILCMPIKNAIGSVIGIAQLMNKLDGTFFNKNDENLFEVGT